MELLTIYVPWIGSLLAELVLLWAMIQRKTARRYPWFFISIAYDVARVVTLLAITVARPHGYAYFYAYWTLMPGEYAIAFAVIYEIFRHAFQSEVRFSPKTLRVFIGFNLILAALAFSLLFSHEIPADNFARLMLVGHRSAELTRCGMLLFLWAFAARLKLGWRNHLWGITLGLGLYSAAGLISAAADVATGHMCTHWLVPIPHFAYLLATIIWAVYLWRAEPAREPLTLEKIDSLRELLALVRDAELQIRRALRDDA